MGGLGPVVLITRSQPEAGSCAARLSLLGCTPIISPVLEIKPGTAPAPAVNGVQAIIATSANGVRAMQNLSFAQTLPLYCFSGASMDAATALGMRAFAHSGNGAQLTAFVTDRLSRTGGAVLWVRGADYAFDVQNALEQAGFEARAWAAYTATKQTKLSAAAAQALRDNTIKLVLFHSARGASAFADIARKMQVDLRTIAAIAISKNAAKPLETAGFQTIHCAAEPTEAAIMRCVQAQF